jgi:small subunit ribosomal protein S21
MQNYKRQHRHNNNYSNYNSHDRKPKPEFERRPQGLQVFVRDGEDISKALRKLKKKVEAAGILKDLRDKQYYQKPSEKRRIAKKAGIARWKKRQKELEMNR